MMAWRDDAYAAGGRAGPPSLFNQSKRKVDMKKRIFKAKIVSFLNGLNKM